MELVHGKTDCRPEETGYDASRLDVLNRHFERLMEKEIIVGAAYAISHKGKIFAELLLTYYTVYDILFYTNARYRIHNI